MSHFALARKYRPRLFSELVGQEHVAAGLAGAIAKDRVAHGYLLTGPRGTGKTTAARILAMALNCETPPKETPGEPCGACSSCERIWAGSANLDVVEIDAASNRGVDDARDLRERAMYAASGPDRYKVYIVDEAHMLTREAWNALLKILEEPPSKVVFVFATTDPMKIASSTTAVLSRLQRFDFKSIGSKAIESRLNQVAAAEYMEIDADSIRLIGQVANGGMRDALSLLDQALAFGEGAVSIARVREALGLIDDEAYVELLGIIADRRSDAVFPFVSRLVDMGADLEQFVTGMAAVLRALMLSRINGVDDSVSDAVRAGVDLHADRFSTGDVMRMISLLSDAEENIRRSPNARLHVETLILHWTMLDRAVDLAAVIAQIGGGGPPSGGGDRPVPPSPSAGAPSPSRSRGNPPPRSGRSTGQGAKTVSAPETTRRVPKPESVGDLHGMRAIWPSVVETLSQRSPLVREFVARSEPSAFDGQMLDIEVDDDMHREGLERKKPALEALLQELIGHPVSVRVTAREAPKASELASAKRQTAEDDREARLKTYRAQDPSLDAMAEALDLELRE